MTIPPFEAVYTQKHEVCCAGNDGPLGHPRVYLHILEETGSVQCPYCSRMFIHKRDADRYATL